MRMRRVPVIRQSQLKLPKKKTCPTQSTIFKLQTQLCEGTEDEDKGMPWSESLMSPVGRLARASAVRVLRPAGRALTPAACV
jgi:hypothetical protein